MTSEGEEFRMGGRKLEFAVPHGRRKACDYLVESWLWFKQILGAALAGTTEIAVWGSQAATEVGSPELTGFFQVAHPTPPTNH